MNRIRRQVVEVQVEGAEQAAAVQDRLGRLMRGRVVRLIDDLCRELTGPDELVRLDRVEVDLGPIAAANLEDHLIERLKPRLKKALGREIERQREGNRGRRSVKSGSQLELLSTFLQTGVLPWWADATRPDQIEAVVGEIGEADPTALLALLQLFRGRPAALRRLVNHLAEEAIARLLVVLRPALPAEATGRFSAQLVALYKSDRVWRRAVWLSALDTALSKDSYSELNYQQETVTRLALKRGQRYGGLVDDLQERLERQRGSEPLSRVITVLHDALPKPADTTIEIASKEMSPDDLVGDSARGKRLSPDPTHQKETSTKSANNRPPQEGAEIDPAVGRQEELAVQSPATVPPSEIDDIVRRGADTPDGLFVHNAGLVILWPFLTRFFERLALNEDGQFKSKGARQRAVGLLHWLAFGRTDADEYQLPLNKVLCGFDLLTPFEVDEPLTETDQREGGNLLAAVIAQASVLNDMSLDGLRGSFLIREGVLRSQDGAWLLRVERETFDIVLERFPWRWDWIRLPWMDHPMRVEWLS